MKRNNNSSALKRIAFLVAAGAVGFTNAVNPAAPQLFYRIRVP
jgi:hypothetical protein